MKYHWYVTKEDESSIVLSKDLGFTIDLHVEVSEIFILHGKKRGVYFIHVDCVDFVLEYDTMVCFGLCLRGLSNNFYDELI